jgi:hypothetical protein
LNFDNFFDFCQWVSEELSPDLGKKFSYLARNLPICGNRLCDVAQGELSVEFALHRTGSWWPYGVVDGSPVRGYLHRL